ncbi:MAG: histidine phosphatase family protein [Planctomycetota bacterium]|nr:MAG: histidine phosphatase family protein [Planctomycetota bacterium]
MWRHHANGRRAAWSTLAVLAALLVVPLLVERAVAGQDAALELLEPTTVFFLRHAEKGTDDARDPELSERGTERAAALAELLEHAGVTHLFASEFRRTQATLAPLAEALGLEVEIVSARSPDVQVAALRALPAGSVAVVAGHSNTTPALVRALGGEVGRLKASRSGDVLGEDEYGRLFVVVLPPPERRVAVQTLELAY